eukprot:7243798-Prymnesium_polylepis.1
MSTTASARAVRWAADDGSPHCRRAQQAGARPPPCGEGRGCEGCLRVGGEAAQHPAQLRGGGGREERACLGRGRDKRHGGPGGQGPQAEGHTRDLPRVLHP